MQVLYILLDLCNIKSPGLFISNNPENALNYQKQNQLEKTKLEFLFDIFSVNIEKTVYLLINNNDFSVVAASNNKKEMQIYQKDEKLENCSINIIDKKTVH